MRFTPQVTRTSTTVHVFIPEISAEHLLWARGLLSIRHMMRNKLARLFSSKSEHSFKKTHVTGAAKLAED